MDFRALEGWAIAAIRDGEITAFNGEILQINMNGELTQYDSEAEMMTAIHELVYGQIKTGL